MLPGFNEAGAIKPRKPGASWRPRAPPAGFNEAGAIKPRKLARVQGALREDASLQ